MAVEPRGARKGKAAGRRSASSQQKQRFEVLHHPWRTRILEVLNERDMSVSQFVDEGLIGDLDGQPRDRAISALAYHFRALREAGAIEIVEQNPRRGSTELVCRACARAYVPDEDWSRLPLHKRRAISRVMLDSFIARAESAAHQGTLDSRTDRHIAWLAMEVDEQGWTELAALLNGVLETVTAIHRESKQRLEASEEQPIRATWGQLHFESPPLLAIPATD
jgi:DNA-binding transcriptional ArsR family regulator